MTALLDALQQLHSAGSPLSPAAIEDLHTLVVSAIDGDLRVQNAGERDAAESYAAGRRLREWLLLHEWLCRVS